MRTANREEPAKRGSGVDARRPAGSGKTAQRGAPHTYAAHAVRKDVTVRVSLAPPAPPDSEELGEHGYGHGV
jgi:hypothetical protein